MIIDVKLFHVQTRRSHTHRYTQTHTQQRTQRHVRIVATRNTGHTNRHTHTYTHIYTTYRHALTLTLSLHSYLRVPARARVSIHKIRHTKVCTGNRRRDGRTDKQTGNKQTIRALRLSFLRIFTQFRIRRNNRLLLA